MLKKQFGYQVLNVNSPEEIDVVDLKKSDLIAIQGHHPGGIYHSQYLQFQQPVDPDIDPMQIFRSANDRRKIRKSLHFFEQEGYTFAVSQMKKKDHQQFKKLYQQSIKQKKRAVHYSVDDRVLGRILTGVPVYLLGMYRQQKLESCLVFFIDTNQTAVVSFGVKKRFNQSKISVGGTLHYKLYEFCQKEGATEINLGKSLNPAGLITTAGLFEFKARCGTTAYPEGSWKTTYILNPSIFLSDVVFVSLKNDQLCYVVATDKPDEKIRHKYWTNQINEIEMIDFKTVVKKAKQSLTKLNKQK